MLTFAIITTEQLMVKTAAEVDFIDFLEDTVGVHFGHRQLNESVIIENNILEELNPLATKMFNKNVYGTVIVINRQDDCYQSLSKEQLEYLHENYQSKIAADEIN
jgi:hypothetical protein